MLFNQLVRFCSVGLLNTVADIAIYTGLRSAGVPLVLANIASTSCGLALSYILNSRYTFQMYGNRRRVAEFMVVTVAGLWCLQPLLIASFGWLLDRYNYGLLHYITSSHTLRLAIPKLAATAVTLVWNYLWYSLVVFKAGQTQRVNSASGRPSVYHGASGGR